MIGSKTKYETKVHNSEKYFSSHEKMKKCLSSHEKIKLICNLATQTPFNKKIKQTTVMMNLFSVHYHLKVEQMFYTAN